MTELNIMWTLVADVMRLQPAATEAVVEMVGGGRIALLLVLLAGISEAIGESVVLFVNRVPPRRFALSIFLSSLLFAITYLAVTLSIFLVGRFIFEASADFPLVARVVGFAYAPRLLGFLAFLPFFGVPIQATLRAWSVLALLVAVTVALDLRPWESLATVTLGSLLLMTVERTVGRPIIGISRWLRARAAGVDLVTDRKLLRELIDAGPDRGLRPQAEPAGTRKGAGR